MGINVQSSKLQQIANSISENIYNQVVNVTNRQAVRCQINQNINAVLGGCENTPSVFRGNVTLSQTASNECALTAQVLNDIRNNFDVIIRNALEQTAQQESSNLQEFLAIAANVQVQDLSNIQNVINRIERNIQANIKTDCINDTITNQGTTAKLCGTYYRDIVISQNAEQRAIAQCLTNNVFEAIQNDTVLNQLVQNADQKATSEQQGLGSTLRWLIWLVVALVVLGVIGLIIYFIIKSRRPSVTPSLSQPGFSVATPQGTLNVTSAPMSTGPLTVSAPSITSTPVTTSTPQIVTLPTTTANTVGNVSNNVIKNTAGNSFGNSVANSTSILVPLPIIPGNNM